VKVESESAVFLTVTYIVLVAAYKVLSDPIMRANHDCFVCIPHTPPQKQQCRFNNTNANNPHPQQSPNFHYANANQRDPGFFCPSDAKREKEAAERLKKDKETEEHFIIEKIKRDKFYSFFDQNPRCTEPTIMQCTKQAQQQVHSQRLDSLDEKKRRETNRQLILRTVAKTLWIPQNCYKRLVKIIRRRVRREKIRF